MEAMLQEALADVRPGQAAEPPRCEGCASEPARADDPVCVHYFARRSGLAVVTILQGKAGTGEVPAYSKRPRRWLRSEVDRFLRERAASLRSPKVKAMRLLRRKSA